MTKDNSYTPSCVDCGTQNCKFKDRTYPEFCLTTGLDTEDLEWALERYDEGQNHDVMVASAEVEFEGYCRLTRVEEIMTFARKMGYKKIGIANCIGLINEARIFARILSQRIRSLFRDMQSGGSAQIIRWYPSGM